MSRPSMLSYNTPRPRTAYTLTEVTVATAIVGLLLVAALRTLAQGTAGQMFNARRAQALLLASDLMAEIVELPYEDPNVTPSFGAETGETGSTTRSAFDDVDDYHGWTENPPKDKAGTSLANASGFTRSVSVSWLNPDNLTSVAVSESGVKRIVVTVSGNGVQSASQNAVVARK